MAAQDRLLEFKPLIHRLHLFFGVRRIQMFDGYVRRRYQDGFGMRERVETILPIIIPDARGSNTPVRHGFNKQEDIGLIYGATAERKRLHHAIDRLLISAEHVSG